VAGKSDAFLKFSLAASLMVASASVGYYYVVYLPARDAQLDRERLLDIARSEIARRAEQDRLLSEQKALRERLLSEQQEAQERQLSERAAAQNRYNACLSSSRADYDANWTAACKRIADRATKARAECDGEKSFCDKVYPVDTSPNCALPRVIATDYETTLEKAKDRCLQESKSGLQ
jgi:leucyl aminopeptidase (aminopeptidase T)